MKVDITTVPEDDRDTWTMIQEGRVKGCFQIESHLGKTWCKALKPSSIEELAALISIIRPGTLKSFVDGKSMTQHFVDRKHEKEAVPSLHEKIDSILKETHGVIVYQEQAMEIAVKMAGFNLKEADDLRKAIGKKKADLMKEVRVKFISGSKENGIDEAKAVEIFDMIEKSARYSFNKSHAIAYSKMAYWSAWLKCKYSEKFFKNWLRGADDKIDPDVEKRQLIMAAKAENIVIAGPHINLLEESFSWHSGAIHFGICNVKNVGNAHLIKLKEMLSEFGTVKNWTTILIHALMPINKRAIENLISVGAFSGLGKTRTEMLHEYHCFSELTDKEIKAIQDNIDISENVLIKTLEKFLELGLKKNGGFIATQSRLTKVQDVLTRLINPGRSLSDNPAVYSKIEENLLGYAINHSELNACSEAGNANATCKEVSGGRAGHCIIAGVVKKVREHMTKNGDKMAFLSAEDETGELENIVIFPDIYEQNKAIIYEQATVLLSGEIKDHKRNSFIVEKVFQI